MGAYKVYLDRIVQKPEFVQRVLNVNLNDIKGIINRWINNKEFSLTVMGDLNESENLVSIHKKNDQVLYEKTE